MRNRIRLLMVSKIDDGYLTDYLQKQASKGYRLIRMVEPFLIFEKDEQAATNIYTAVPRDSFEANLRMHKPAPDHLLVTGWRFHIITGESDAPVSVVSQYLDMLIYFVLYAGLLGGMLRYMELLPMLGYSYERFLPIVILSGIIILWQLLFLVLRFQSVGLYKKLQKAVPVRNLLTLLLIGLWGWDILSPPDILHILCILLLLVLLMCVRIGILNGNRSYWLRGTTPLLIVGIMVLSGMRLYSLYTEDAYACRKDAFTLYLKDLGQKAKTTDCFQNEKTFSYQESDQKYTHWYNDENLPKEDRENIVSNYFSHYKNENAAAEEYRSQKESLKDSYGEPNNLDASWKVDQGYFMYGDGIEVLMVQKGNRIYEYTMEKGNGYDGEWMEVVKHKFFSE